MVKILFVCLGNICRSPTAQGVFERLLAEQNLSDRIQVDSAGTAAWHVGESPDSRSQQAAKRRRIDLSRQRSRQITGADYDDFDYIVAMDRANLHSLRQQCPVQHAHKVRLFLDFAPHLDQSDVPDPYYGGLRGFDNVLDLIEIAAAGLLQDVREQYLA